MTAIVGAADGQPPLSRLHGHQMACREATAGDLHHGPCHSGRRPKHDLAVRGGGRVAEGNRGDCGRTQSDQAKSPVSKGVGAARNGGGSHATTIAASEGSDD